MKERPILFSAPMIRALLDGSKTQTRRVVKLPHQNPLGEWKSDRVGGPNGGRLKNGDTIPEQWSIWHTRTGECQVCPYGQPGDRLWVRETWRDYTKMNESCVLYRADDVQSRFGWSPSIFMPRWASRITLEIVSVRVDRLQDISADDAVAEGIFKLEYRGQTSYADYSLTDEEAEVSPMLDSPIESYRTLWDSINAKSAPWSSNPWVWVVEFKRVMP